MSSLPRAYRSDSPVPPPELPPRWLDLNSREQAFALEALAAAARAWVEGRPAECRKGEGLCRCGLCDPCNAAEALVLIGAEVA